MFPSFSADVERYAITTTGRDRRDGHRGRCRHHEPVRDRCLVNGAPAPGGHAHGDAGSRPGTRSRSSSSTAERDLRHSGLPAGWIPDVAARRLRRLHGHAVAGPRAADAGAVGAALARSSRPPSTRTACPVYVGSQPTPWTSSGCRTALLGGARRRRRAGGADIVELDEQFREVASYRTVGLHHTDGHDSILLPDGSRYLMAYEPDASDPCEENVEDAIVQHVSASGQLLFEWNSNDHVDIPAETVVPTTDRDYAHINSVRRHGRRRPAGVVPAPQRRSSRSRGTPRRLRRG